MSSETLRQTPLHEQHLLQGGRMVGFAGWSMPVQYEGVREEHLAVRTHAGMFDVSHMGEVEVEGPGALAFLQHVLSNDVAAVAVGGAQYSCLCQDDGGVLDDLFAYRLGRDRFLVVTNAANHRRDLDWFRRHAGGEDVEVADRAGELAMLAVQGPSARDALGRLAGAGLPPRMRVAELTIAGAEALVCGTGYTGEDGCELLLAPADAPLVWGKLLAAGVRPCGLGARDTLRLEACFHLYGNDLCEDRDPLGAGLGWCCRLETGFIGSAALAARGEGGATLVPFAFTGPGIPRRGNPVHTVWGEGVVTSGSLSPCLETGIGLAYVPREAAAPGTAIEVDVRGTRRTAEVRSKPLYPAER